jgi:transcriptional regulator with XRE-family HTH domain
MDDATVGELGGLRPLLRAWRAEAGRALGLGHPLGQRELAEAADVSERWYRKLEAGERVRPDPARLDRIAAALELDHARTATLFLYASGQMPVISQGQKHTVRNLSLLLEQLMPAPAWISNSMWDIVECNAAAADWFPWMRKRGGNMVRWFLLHREARAYTVGWQEQAADFLGLLRYAYALHSESPQYRALLGEVLSDRDCLALWKAHPHVTASRSGTKFVLALPHHDFQRVEVLAHFLHSADDPTHRISVLTQISGPASDDAS